MDVDKTTTTTLLFFQIFRNKYLYHHIKSFFRVVVTPWTDHPFEIKRRYRDWKDASDMITHGYVSMLIDKIKCGDSVWFNGTHSAELVASHVVNFNQFMFLYNLKRCYFIGHRVLEEACKRGNIDIVRVLFSQTTPCQLYHPSIKTQILTNTFTNGDIDLLEYVWDQVNHQDKAFPQHQHNGSREEFMLFGLSLAYDSSGITFNHLLQKYGDNIFNEYLKERTDYHEIKHSLLWTNGTCKLIQNRMKEISIEFNVSNLYIPQFDSKVSIQDRLNILLMVNKLFNNNSLDDEYESSITRVLNQFQIKENEVEEITFIKYNHLQLYLQAKYKKETPIVPVQDLIKYSNSLKLLHYYYHQNYSRNSSVLHDPHQVDHNNINNIRNILIRDICRQGSNSQIAYILKLMIQDNIKINCITDVAESITSYCARRDCDPGFANTELLQGLLKLLAEDSKMSYTTMPIVPISSEWVDRVSEVCTQMNKYHKINFKDIFTLYNVQWEIIKEILRSTMNRIKCSISEARYIGMYAVLVEDISIVDYLIENHTMVSPWDMGNAALSYSSYSFASQLLDKYKEKIIQTMTKAGSSFLIQSYSRLEMLKLLIDKLPNIFKESSKPSPLLSLAIINYIRSQIRYGRLDLVKYIYGQYRSTIGVFSYDLVKYITSIPLLNYVIEQSNGDIEVMQLNDVAVYWLFNSGIEILEYVFKIYPEVKTDLFNQDLTTMVERHKRKEGVYTITYTSLMVNFLNNQGYIYKPEDETIVKYFSQYGLNRNVNIKLN